MANRVAQAMAKEDENPSSTPNSATKNMEDMRHTLLEVWGQKILIVIDRPSGVIEQSLVYTTRVGVGARVRVALGNNQG